MGEKGIFNYLTTEGAIFKYGSGAGSNYSKLRGKDERLSNGGKSSGLLSFLRVFDRAAGAIKSGGTTRRAAKMVTLDIDHPDLLEFIDWKVKEEKKGAFYNKIYLEYVDEEKRNLDEEKELNKEFRK